MFFVFEDWEFFSAVKVADMTSEIAQKYIKGVLTSTFHVLPRIWIDQSETFLLFLINKSDKTLSQGSPSSSLPGGHAQKGYW